MLTQAFISQSAPASVSPFPPGSNPPVTFVFRPGGVAGDNVYTTWATLYAAFSVVEGPKWVQVDSSLAVATVDAGTWDVRDVNWVGHFGDISPNAQLDFADGAEFVNLGSISQVLTFISHSSSPVVNVPLGTTYVVYLHEGVNIGCDGTAPFFSVGATQLVLVTFISAAILDLGQEVIDLYDTGQVIVVGFDMGGGLLSGQLAANTVSGVVGSTLVLPGDSNAILSTTQPNFLGTISSAFMDDATRLAYTLSPLNTGTPGNAAAALDQASYVLQGAANPNAGGGTATLPGWKYAQSVGNVWVAPSSSATDWRQFQSSIQQKSTGATTTSGAVTSTCDTIPTPDNTITDLDVVVVAKRSNGGSVAARYRMTAAYQWVAGVATIVGAITVIAADADAGALGWAATLTPSGTDVLIDVTGSVGDDIQWYSVTNITYGLVISP